MKKRKFDKEKALLYKVWPEDDPNFLNLSGIIGIPPRILENHDDPEFPSQARPFDLPHAPVFHPTEEEWQNPIQYMEWIRATVGDEFGLAKIIPPSSWQPPFVIDPTVL